MSQLHAELTEQAYELGFENLEEALANGYEVDYEECRLLHPYVLTNKEHEKAHEAWLKERDELIKRAEELLGDTENFEPTAQEELRNLVRDLTEFVKGCYD